MSAPNFLPALPEYTPPRDPYEMWSDYQLNEHSGIGLLQQYGGDSQKNYEVYDFMESQFKRFGLIPPQEDVLEWCWDMAFYLVDQVDPYIFFQGATDVVLTNEPYYHQCAVREEPDAPFEEIEPENLELYRYWAEGSESYHELMKYPGLQEHFEHIYESLMDYVGNMYDGDDCFLREAREKYGPKAKDLIHLGTWAAVMWMISPQAKSWRFNFHPIFQLCYEGGACLLNNWRFYGQEYFYITPRQIKSCGKCGIHEWCAELVQDKESKNFIYMCESCESDKEPFPGRTCGTRMCTVVKCPNHPAHAEIDKLTGNTKVRMIAADRRYGEMRALPNGLQVRELPGMMHVNHKMIEHYSKSIAGDMGKVLTALLENR